MPRCSILRKLDVVVTYVYPCGQPHWDVHAQRFVDTYRQHPAGYDHRVCVVWNGGFNKDRMDSLFAGMPAFSLQHDNSGWDIGAYQLASRSVPCDIMVFFGNSTYIKRDGWLERMIESFYRHGPNLFGCMGHTGDLRFRVFPHVRTTAFWIPPAILNLYPTTISIPEQRYNFEHGPNCLSNWIKSVGLRNFIAAWSGDFELERSNMIPNGYHNGDQSNLIVGDRMSAPPFYPVA